VARHRVVDVRERRRRVLVPDHPHEVRAGVGETHTELHNLIPWEPGEATEADVDHRPSWFRVQPPQHAHGLGGRISLPGVATLQGVVVVVVDKADRPDGEHLLPRVLLVVFDVPLLEVSEQVDDPPSRGVLGVEHAVQELT